ncbi:MAG: GlsB/YeaQ/YmgE family stress response membrane protein [Oscillospiraceae bacterium]|nr:GlsB/YeaQ/YmgE family stress response membrane protein [Oscillospiraceae bacterium]
MGWLINLIVTLAVGGVSGWLAGKIMKTENSIVMNIIIGLIGGGVGGIVMSFIGLGATNIIGDILISVVGACLCIFVYNKFIKK